MNKYINNFVISILVDNLCSLVVFLYPYLEVPDLT